MLTGFISACPSGPARRGKGSFVTETTTGENTAPEAGSTPRRSGALSAMRLAQLQQLASSMGITGTAKMRKSDLISAIREQQSRSYAPSGGKPTDSGSPETTPAKGGTPAASAPATDTPTEQTPAPAKGDTPPAERKDTDT